MGGLVRGALFAITLGACVNLYSEGPPVVVAPAVDAGATTSDADTTPPPPVVGDALLAPPCNLAQPFGTPAVVGGLGSIEAVFPSLSSNERTIVFSDGATLFIAERPSATEPFAVAPRPIVLAKDGPETSVTLSADGFELFFANAPVGSYFSRLYRSTRASAAVDFIDAPTAVKETEGLGFSQNGPSLTANGRAIYFSAVFADNQWQIHRAARTGTQIEKPVPVLELDTAGVEYGVAATADELTIYFSSDRPLASTTTNSNIYVATRTALTVPFGAPRPVDELNIEPANETMGWVSPDGCRIYFSSTRSGPNRIYVAAKP